MALLAEPRRRQKYSIDPRGLNWSNDEEKFGHKMLEKMGWTKGKGLGANEDGNPDHVTVKHKADTRGVGCTKKHADNWLAHQDDFNSLLSALSEDHGPDTTEDSMTSSVSVQNLEEKAQQQKSRVHYKKFTKGKDLSRYGSTDLDSILGKRKSASAPVTPQVQSEANSDTEEQKDDTASNPEEDKDDKTGSLFGVTTIINTTSIADYFAKKMAALKESRIKKDGADGQCADPDVQREESSTPTVETASVDSVDYSREQPKKKKKSRKIKKNICTETCSEDSTEIEKQSGVGKKSKKLKKSKQCQDEEKTFTEVVTRDVETPLEGRQKNDKSKKNKQRQEEDLSTEVGSHNSPDVETRLEVGKKSKESRKRKRDVVRCSNASREEDVTNEADNSKKQKKNPPRKKGTKSNGIDLEESQPTDVKPPAEIKKTKKSKKEKCEKTVNCLDVGSISDESQEIDQVNTGENKSSKKSKKKRKRCNEGSDYCADSSELLENNVALQSSKEKKPRKLENTKASVTSTESVSPGTKTDQVKPDIDSPEDKQQTVKQKLKRKKNKKEKNRKRRNQDLEKLEKSGKGHGFVGSNLDDIGGYGGGFVVQYPWADKN